MISPFEIVIVNIAHWLAGALLALAGLMTLVNAGRPAEQKRWPRLAPLALVVLGSTLVLVEIVDPLIHRVLGAGTVDPMRVYHSIVGLLAALSGAAELVRLRKRGPDILIWAFPACWLGIGVVFLIHEQPTTVLLYRHWAFALTVGAAGVLKMLAERRRSVSLEKAWGVLAILAGLQFVFYFETPADHGAAPGSHGAPGTATTGTATTAPHPSGH